MITLSKNRKNILVNTIKNNGVKGVVNLGLFFFEKWKKPDKVSYNPPSITFEVTTFCNLKCTMCANPSLGKISNESPVGKALMGHKVGEEVVISSPIKTVYKIKKIRYLSS